MLIDCFEDANVERVAGRSVLIMEEGKIGYPPPALVSHAFDCAIQSFHVYPPQLNEISKKAKANFVLYSFRIAQQDPSHAVNWY